MSWRLRGRGQCIYRRPSQWDAGDIPADCLVDRSSGPATFSSPSRFKSWLCRQSLSPLVFLLAMLCPHFLNNGICPDQSGCPHEHPNFFCDTCARSFTSQAHYSAHFATHQHRKAEKAAFRTYATAPRKCTICSVKLGGPSNVRQHEQGRAHRVRLQDLAQRGIQYAPEEMYPVDENSVFHCDICDTMEWTGREAHLSTVRHRNKEAYLSVRAALDEAEKDKYGICVSHGDKNGVDFGIVDTNIRYKTGLTITSTIPNTKYLLLSIKLSSSYSSNVRSRDSPYVTFPLSLVATPPANLLLYFQVQHRLPWLRNCTWEFKGNCPSFPFL